MKMNAETKKSLILPWYHGCEYKCKICKPLKDPYYSAPDLTLHMRSLHGIDIDLYFEKFGSLETKRESYKCQICGDEKIGKNFEEINYHLREKHETNIYDYQTNHLGIDKKVEDPQMSRVQQEIRQQGKKRVCGTCNRVCASGQALRTHMRQHTGEKPCKCQECPYTASALSAFNFHKSRHESQKDKLRCEKCSQLFLSRGQFHLHKDRCGNPGLRGIYSSNKNKIFACPNCPKVYPDQRRLFGHGSTCRPK